MPVVLDSYTILPSVALISVGSLTFYVSSLISGHDIYKDASDLEATFLLTIAGLVVFLLSPISFIILLSPSENYSRNLIQILNLNLIGLFLATAAGLGLIFGYFIVLNLRYMFSNWIKDNLSIDFWVDTYVTLWDDFFNTIKKDSEILVETVDNKGKRKILNCFLVSVSIRDEEKALIVDVKKGNSTVQTLIFGDEIKRITTPDYSFKKHFEWVDHIGQSFYCLMISIGFFALSFVSLTTKKYVNNDIKGFNLTYQVITNVTASPDTIRSIYSLMSDIFLVFSLIFLAVSAYLARKDFDSPEAYIRFCPKFVSLFLILAPFFYFATHFEITFTNLIIYFSIMISFFVFIGFLVKKPIDRGLKNIIEQFEDDESLRKIIKSLYLYYPLNTKSSIDQIINEGKIYRNLSDPEKALARSLNKKITDFKKDKKYLINEDINIILGLKNILKGNKNPVRRIWDRLKS